MHNPINCPIENNYGNLRIVCAKQPAQPKKIASSSN